MKLIAQGHSKSSEKASCLPANHRSWLPSCLESRFVFEIELKPDTLIVERKEEILKIAYRHGARNIQLLERQAHVVTVGALHSSIRENVLEEAVPL